MSLYIKPTNPLKYRGPLGVSYSLTSVTYLREDEGPVVYPTETSYFIQNGSKGFPGVIITGGRRVITREITQGKKGKWVKTKYSRGVCIR